VLRALCRTGALDLLTAAYPALAALPGAEGDATRRGLAGVHTALRGRPTALLLTPPPLPGSPRGDVTPRLVGAEALVHHTALRVLLLSTGPRLDSRPWGQRQW